MVMHPLSDSRTAGAVPLESPTMIATTAPSPDDRSDERATAKPFPIVGIGASAGGLEAFSRLLGHLPRNPGVAFVLVQHLEPAHSSQLAELLSKYTRLPIEEATDGMNVEKDHVYVIPPNTTMSIAGGVLRLAPRGESRAPHLSIDHFLRSLAKDQGRRAVGVVLSGSGCDGTEGLSEIKAVDGITFAQDEGTAKHPSMPGHAAESGHVDFVLSPEAIADRLATIGSHPDRDAEWSARLDEGSQRADFQRILGAVLAVTGIDFKPYRDKTILRRIMRRMALHGHPSMADYVTHLEADRPEVEALCRDFLIKVTGFFRDPELFEELKTRVFPELARNRDASDTIRIWVAGCSTGQEAYSIAIAVTEFLDRCPVRPAVQIFATDVGDAASLAKARSGAYPESIAAEVSPERLARFFTKEDHVYRVGKGIRDMCVFARQDLATDPPFSRVDVISCRNVLIYMAPALQQRVVPTFHHALNTPGFLVLGNSEAIGEFKDLFEPFGGTHGLFLKRPIASRPYRGPSSQDHPTIAPTRGTTPTGPVPDYQKEADRLVLHEYVPPGVLVNSDLDVLQFRGKTGPYLEFPSGKPTKSLLKMAREGLLLELRSALDEAMGDGRPVFRQGVRVRGDFGDREIGLRILTVRVGESAERCYLVLFEEGGSHRARRADDSGTATAPESPEAPVGGFGFWRRRPLEIVAGTIPRRRAEDRPVLPGLEAENVQLRHELSASKEYLQSLIEQQDAVNEELRGANEEILSSNEELQSTNEELETAKEELQSTNEEMVTVNEQLQNRNLEANLLSDDLTNFLTSTSIPALVVGLDLRIRRATPAARQAMGVLITDVGRPVTDFVAGWSALDLESRITGVIETVQPWSGEVRDPAGIWWMLHIHPYRTLDDRIDGTVIHLQEIDKSKRTEGELEEARAYAQAIVETVNEPLIVLDEQMRIKSANRAFYEIFALTPSEAEERSLFDLTPLSRLPALERMLEQVVPKGSVPRNVSTEVMLLHLGPRSVIFSARGIDRADRPPLILLAIRDVSEERRARDEIVTADRRKDEFLAMLAHELRNPLGSVVFALETLRMPESGPEHREQAHGVMRRQVHHLVRMVDDLLDMSRITQGKIAIHKERVELAPIVRAAVETCRHAIESSGHRLTVDLPPESVILDADPTRLAQVISNLLHNAAKFTPHGGVIGVDVEVAPHEGGAAGSVVIHVRDNGAGISAELLPRIFEMFAQGDRSLQRARSGLGVGLTLVKSLVTEHGGTVEARSHGRGKGSEFTIRLPRASALAPASKPGDPPAAADANGVPLRVLVVDDNEDFAEMVKLTLQGMGHEVRLAHDGQVALHATLDWKPDAVLLDIGLPLLNGYEVARRIRAEEGSHHAGLVALTGWGETDDMRRSIEAGFDHHLVKPADKAALGRVMAEIQAARKA